MASKDGTPASAGIVEDAKTAAGSAKTTVVDASTKAVDAATGCGKQAGAYVKTPELGTEKKEESKVGGAATNMVDGVKEQTGTYVEMLKTELPAKIEEMKNGGEKEDEKEDGVIGGVKKFATGETK